MDRALLLLVLLCLPIASIGIAGDSGQHLIYGYSGKYTPYCDYQIAFNEPISAVISHSKMSAFRINTVSKEFRTELNLRLVMLNSGQIMLIWDEVPEALSYTIFCCSSLEPFEDDAWEPLITLPSGTSEYVIDSLSRQVFFYITYWSPSSIPDSFVLVNSGTFYPTPDYCVTLSGYYIDKYELTQADFQAVMGTNPAYDFGVGDSYPVYNISWFDVIEYCNRRSIQEGLSGSYSYGSFGTDPDYWPPDWNTDTNNHINVCCNWNSEGYRLPTEMEWMYAAKGGCMSQGYIFSGSNIIDEVAWYWDDFYDPNLSSHQIGGKAPNELGTFDMSGNISEWVWDIQDSYTSGNWTDPTGPLIGANRGCRGGSFGDFADWCSVFYRASVDPTICFPLIGTRLVRKMP